MDGLGGDVEGLPAGADPKQRAAVYADIGLKLMYDLGEDRVDVQVRPRVCKRWCRRGDLTSEYTPVLRGVLML